MLKKNKSVVSLGGGAFLNRSIRSYIKINSKSFWLDLNIEVLIKVKQDKQKAFVIKKNISEAVKKIYYERKKTYSEADFRIRCDSLKTEKITNKILRLYEN